MNQQTAAAARKALATTAILLVIANLVLIALGRISLVTFWVIIGLCAAVAYIILPRLNPTQ